MLICNPKVDSSNKPTSASSTTSISGGRRAEKFFNKTNPQNLNGQTLPPNFDLAAGHQLQSARRSRWRRSLKAMYRLEIKVTDKIANKT